MFLTKKIRIAVFDTSEKEERLRSVIESLANNERTVSLNGSPANYIIEYHDSNVNESLRKVKINGSRIIAANYALLIEGALCREKIAYKQMEVDIAAKRWKKM